MSRSKNRKIADLISGTTFDDGVVAASEVTGLHPVASTGNFNELENKPAPFDPATLAGVAVSGSFNDLSDQPAPFDPATLSTVAVSGSFNDLSNQPAPFDPSTLATVATTGAYSSLSGTPALITNTNQLTNGAGYITTSGVAVATSAPTGSDGQLYYNTSEDKLYCFNATKGIWEFVVIEAGLVANTVSGSQLFTTAGSFTWSPPSGVNNFAVVAVGAGAKGGDYGPGGGGGALAYANFIVTTSTDVWNIDVGLCDTSTYPTNIGGGYSRLYKTGGTDIVKAGGGAPLTAGFYNNARDGQGSAGGVFLTGDGGGHGGRGGNMNDELYKAAGGGGAGGYSGNGGRGGDGRGNGQSGSGGGGGGGGNGYSNNGYATGTGGGGVGLNGQGSNGAGGTSINNASSPTSLATGGGGGSGGATAASMSYNSGNAAGGAQGGTYGGGGGATSNNSVNSSNGSNGAVRIVWKTGNPAAYYFPSTNVN
mgnify:CR=1 FL=1